MIYIPLKSRFKVKLLLFAFMFLFIVISVVFCSAYIRLLACSADLANLSVVYT